MVALQFEKHKIYTGNVEFTGYEKKKKKKMKESKQLGVELAFFVKKNMNNMPHALCIFFLEKCKFFLSFFAVKRRLLLLGVLYILYGKVIMNINRND